MLTTKRCISLILVAILFLGLIPSTASAGQNVLTGEGPSDGAWPYVSQSKVLSTEVTGTMLDLSEIPDMDSAPGKRLGIYGGHTYTLFDGTASSWADAKEYCELLGGHLATITSAEENAFLYNYMQNCGYSNAYWGLTDQNVEGVWEWCTGEPVTYLNWASGEPNDDYDSAEDFGMFWDEKPGGVWNDGVFGDDGQAFLCEWDCILPEAMAIYNDHAYMLVQADVSSWEDAQTYCESMGGHLATITSAEENDFIYSYIVECGYRNAYFGLTEKNNEGEWEWVTGEPVEYLNWHSGEPNDENGHENYAMFYYKFSDGTWNDGDFGQGTVDGEKNFICEWDTAVVAHDTIGELTEVDYWVLSHIAYWNFDKYLGKTMKEALTGMGKWDKTFEDTDMKYSELCGAIGHWKLVDVENYSNINGFYGVTFANGDDAVVAYRGSIPLTSADAVFSKDALFDWVLNDLYPILANRLFSQGQYKNAIAMYENAAKGYGNIAVTGHSLGGGLADIISAHYGCRGVSMNAISILDTCYTKLPKLFGFSFAGVDKWNFVDHANQFDLLAGSFEIAFSAIGATKLKPVIIHATDSNDPDITKLVYYHGLGSYITRNAQGKPALTGRTGAFIPSSTISNHMATTGTSIDLGTSGNNFINKGLSVATARTSYGGDGHDTISTNVWNDTIIGGKGSDDLDGSWGNDTYAYYKGDDVDIIHDIGGDDRLILLGFDEDDTFSVVEDPGSDYICITNGGKDIVRISKKNREYTLFTTNRFKIVLDHGNDSQTEVFDITDAFDKYKSGEHLYIGCPVHVEVLDPDGNVVYTLTDGEVGSWYTDYGNFYVFEEENGEYGKVLDLVEGYAARIVGAGEGTMEVTYQVPVDGELTDPVSVSGVPVTEHLSATIEESEDGDVYLVIDEDSDGETDSERKLYGECPFTDVPEGSFYYEPVMWAVEEGITSGATETTYNPGGTCLRAQVVTFLHRADGNPEPTSTRNPFTDVKPGDFFYKPVLWAVEKGITSGVSATAFGSYSNCNRAAVVTFLWRAAGSPEPESTNNPFVDVKTTDFFYKPVLWAVENGITAGIDATHFGPTADCNRAQVVTFLYRAFN